MNTKDEIQELINSSKNSTKEYIIIVVGNARKITTNFNDYPSGTSVVSEYYALEKFQKIVTTFQDEGFEVLSYFDEMDFIHDYLTQRIRNNYYKKMIVFNFAQKGIVHGRKSLIPLFCEMNNIIHTNSDPFIASFTREKYLWYKVLKDIVPTCPSWIYEINNGWLDGQPSMGKTIIAKLENQCSSIGLDENSVFVYDENKDQVLYETARKYNSRIFVQEFISGYEVEVPFVYYDNNFFCLKPQGISIDGEIHIKDSYLGYNSRANHLFSFYNFDDIFPESANKIMAFVEKITKVIGIQGMGRIDFRMDDKQNCYVTDINSNPHLIDVASPSAALYQMGFDHYAALLHLIIGITINRHPNQIK